MPRGINVRRAYRRGERGVLAVHRVNPEPSLTYGLPRAQRNPSAAQRIFSSPFPRLAPMPLADKPASADSAPRPLAPYFSSARREGDWVFVSGQMAFDDHLRIAGDTVGEQTRRCLARIDGILQAEGLALADVVKTTVWLGQVADFPEFNESYAAVFAATQAPAPARSTVRADLMMPGALVEIEAIARNRF